MNLLFGDIACAPQNETLDFIDKLTVEITARYSEFDLYAEPDKNVR